MSFKNLNQITSAFNPEKLLWLIQQTIISAPAEKIRRALLPYLEKAGIDPANGPAPEQVADGFHERAETLSRIVENSRYCHFYFETIDVKAAKKNLRPVVFEPMKCAREALAALTEWTTNSVA